MLDHFDFFVQHNSAYKAILRAGRLGLARPAAIMYDMSFYTPATRDQMHQRYGYGLPIIRESSQAPVGSAPVAAGRATVWVF